MADIFETIGASGEHYSSIAAWFSAHNARDMVTAANRYIGLLVDEVYEVDAGTLAALNTGTRSATAYRMLVGSTSQSNMLTTSANPATGGTFTLTVNGQTTTGITVTLATAATIKSAIEALSNVAVGDVEVTAIPTGSNLSQAGAKMRIDWKLALGGRAVTVSANFGSLTGGGGSSSIALSTSRTGAEGYKPERHTGPRVYVRWTGTGDQAGLRIDAAENFFRAYGFAMIGEDPQEVTAGNKYLFQIQGDNFVGSRLFARISDGGQRGSVSGALFYCYYVNNVNGNNANLANFLNCIAYGSRFFKGAHEGFFFDSFASNGGCYNCASYQIRHTNGSPGFRGATGSTVKPRLVNCVSVECGVGLSGVWESIALDPAVVSDPLSTDAPYSCVVSDTSTPFGLSTDAVVNNQRLVDARTIFLRPEIQDLRPILGSVVFGQVTDAITQPPVFRRGRDMSKIWSDLGITPEDFDGVARAGATGGYLSDVNGWTIGPYSVAGTPIGTSQVVEEVKSIGSASGRDYANIQAFLDDTDDQSLIYRNKRVIGELYPDSDFSIAGGSRVIARRTIADARRYREIRPAAGHQYDPLTQRGVKISGTGGSTTGENNLVEVHEDHFRITGPIFIDQTFAGVADRKTLKIQGNFVRINSVHARHLAGTSTSTAIFMLRGSRVIVSNCIAVGSNSSGAGANNGFALQNCESSRILCCTAWGLDGSGGGRGFVDGASTSRVEISCCIGVESGTDFFHSASANGPFVQSHNISGDATALGIGSQQSVASATVLRNAASGDFRHVSGSSALKRGKNLSGRFSTDFLGAPRQAPFDIGAFEGLPTGPLFLAPDFKESRAFMTLWELVRPDGQIMLFTDQNEPVTYRGRVYDVGGGFIASNRRAEPEVHSVGVKAAFSSGKITVADLAGGKFRGSRLREILLGRYAWTRPLEENVYLLGKVEFDSDTWAAELASLSSLMDKSSGRMVTVNCPLSLGSEECTVDLVPLTLDDVRVSSTIVHPRRKFNAETADISAGFADDYFGKGYLIWLTGLNVGTHSQIKSYLSSGRVIELDEPVAYDIAAGDTFQLVPGCRKRYLLDCIAKFSNGINFGGDPLMPGTDKSLSTPTR